MIWFTADRVLIVCDSDNANEEIKDYQNCKDVMERKVRDAHSVGEGIWQVTV